MLVVVVMAGLALGYVSAEATARSPAAKVALKRFSSCGELVRFGKRHALEADATGKKRKQQSAPQGLSAPDGAIGQPGGTQEAPAAGAPEFSTTNVQEAGVDEPDVAKTDGKTLFTFAGGYLYALDARAERPRVIGSLKVGEPQEHELLLRGDRALVVSTDYERERTRLAELDVSDPSSMRITDTVRTPGTYVSARLTGQTARVVLSTPPRAEDFEREAAVRKSKLPDWIPYAAIADRETGERVKRKLVPCRAIQRPAVYSGLGMLTVLTVDMDAGLESVSGLGVYSEGDTVYASTKSLYVATERYDDDADEGGLTTVHRFAASEPGQTDYQASGNVLGSLLGQFSLSEHEGKLRAATTYYGNDDKAHSYVTVLAKHKRKLIRIGRTRRLGVDQDIQGVRFIGEAGYVSTYQADDPLHVLNLSNPRAPRVAGELRVYGSSAYLHPVGDDLLVGVGQDYSPRGEPLGAQLSLFDVSDPRRPARLHKYVLSRDSESEVEYEHRAFLYWPPTGLAVLPFERYGNEAAGERRSSGAFGVTIDRRSGIRHAGNVFHRIGEETVSIRRSLVVGDRLFTISGQGVDARDLRTLSGGRFASFPVPDPRGQDGVDAG